MKLKFVIGAGSEETGRTVFWVVIGVNVGIFGFVFYRLITKIKTISKAEVAT